MSWLLEPWNSGPPYDIERSFTDICALMLDRVGCPKENQTNSADVTLVSASNYQCTCGKLSLPTVVVTNLITDKINDYSLRTLPVFADPVYLSVPLSMCIVLICGKLGAILAVYLNLPAIIGFLLAGVGVQNILSPMFLKGAGFPYPSPASELKTIALVIVLMRAGLSTRLDEIYRSSVASLTLSTLPYFGEFFMFMYVGHKIFGWSVIDMGLFSSIMAPLGPSVVISGLLQLLSQKKDYGFLPKQMLISTPIEAVVAIILFGIFSTLETTSVPPMYPWVKLYPLYVNCLLIPLNLLFSTVLGIICGWCVSQYVNYRVTKKTDFIWVRISRNPQMGSSTADLVFALLVTCYTMMSLCNMQYIQQASGVLVVFVTCITVSRCTHIETASDIAAGCKGIWIFAEVFLFTLTGVSLSFDSSNGPLYGQRGLDDSQISKLMAMIFIGTCGRIIGIGISLVPIYFTYPPHRRNWKYMLSMWLATWTYQLPKATVQATLGGVAYQQHVIPGAIGLNRGLFIAQSTAFTVLIFAPIGTMMTKFVGVPLSLYLTKTDNAANWNIEESRYYTEEEIVARKAKAAAEAAIEASAAKEKEIQARMEDVPDGEGAGDTPSTNEGSVRPRAQSIRRSSNHPRGSFHNPSANASEHSQRGGDYDGSYHSQSHHMPPSSHQIDQSDLEDEPTVVDLLSSLSTRVRSATVEAHAVYRRRSSTMNADEQSSMLDLVRGRRKSRMDHPDTDESGAEGASTRRPSMFFGMLTASLSANSNTSTSGATADAPRVTAAGTAENAQGNADGNNNSAQSQSTREYELVSRNDDVENLSTQI
jgi:NhaP-type Na+/H+ or K+/H+ antiporter